MNAWRFNHGGTECTERKISGSQAPAWEPNAPQALPAEHIIQPFSHEAKPLAQRVPRREPGNKKIQHVLSPCSPCLRGLLIIFFASTLSLSLHAQTEKPNYQSRPLYQAIERTLDNLARAEISQEETSLAPVPKQDFSTPRQQCREAIAQLKKIDAQLQTLLTQTYRQRPSTIDANSWTTQQLESLARNLKVQLARAYRNQGLCYPIDSPDRVNSLSLALEQLQTVVNLPLNEPVVWQARLQQVACLRHLQQLQKTQQQITHWQQASPPAPFASQLFGEQIRLHLTQKKLPAALAIIKSHQRAGSTAPETDDAILAALLAARDTQQALQQLQRINTTHGSFWQQRAQLRLGQAFAELTDTDNPQLLSYVAASLYHADKFGEAVAAYDRLAEIHAAQENTDQQFQAAQTAATIVSKNNPLAALDRYHQLALDHPTHTQAATVHWLAVGLAAQQVRSAQLQQRAARFERYLTLLKEHQEKWPTAPTSVQAQQWLTRSELPEVDRLRAENLATTGDHQAAIALYRKLSEKSPNDAQLLEALAQSLSQANFESEQQEALQLWQRLEKRSKPGGPRWLRARQARLQLLKALGEGERAKQLQQLTEILYPNKLQEASN